MSADIQKKLLPFPCYPLAVLYTFRNAKQNSLSFGKILVYGKHPAGTERWSRFKAESRLKKVMITEKIESLIFRPEISNQGSVIPHITMITEYLLFQKKRSSQLCGFSSQINTILNGESSN